MIANSREARLESLIALNNFASGKSDKTLTEEKSRQNISDNLITIVKMGRAREPGRNDSVVMDVDGWGTGLKITTDGWIITAYHNIVPDLDNWEKLRQECPKTKEDMDIWLDTIQTKYSIVGKDGYFDPIDITAYAAEPKYDIALIKAVLYEKPEPIRFNIKTDDFEIGEDICLMGKGKAGIYTSKGKIIENNKEVVLRYCNRRRQEPKTYDTFLTNTEGYTGLSGGSFITSDGKLAGLGTYFCGDKAGNAGGAKIRHIIELIKGNALALCRDHNSYQEFK